MPGVTSPGRGGGTGRAHPSDPTATGNRGGCTGRNGCLRARRIATAILLAVLPWTTLQGAVQVPETGATVSASLSPTSVWMGDEATLTVVVTTAGRDIDQISLTPPISIEIVEVTDRESSRPGGAGVTQLVIERRYQLRPLQAGALAIPPVEVRIGPVTYDSAPLELTVVDRPLRWDRPVARGRPGDTGREPPIVAAGVPLTGSRGPVLPLPVPRGGAQPPVLPAPGPAGAAPPAGRPPYSGAPRADDPGVYPGDYPGGYPAPGYGAPVPTYPMMGATVGGWAATASGDPWWPELVPELVAYQTEAEDLAGIIRLAAGLTPERAYVGQQITYVGSVFLGPRGSMRLRTEPRYQAPLADGFTAIDLVEPGAVGLTARDGEVQSGFTFRRVLFGRTTGIRLVPPASVAYSSGTLARGGLRGESLTVEAIRVEVLPLPSTDVPPSFRGAVGRYRIEGGIAPNRLALGETAALQVRVLGAGYVPGLPPPELGPASGFELVRAADRSIVEVADGVVGGVKVFNWLVIPHAPGLHRIGPVLFAYFDPYLGTYAQVAIDEILLEVLPLP